MLRVLALGVRRNSPMCCRKVFCERFSIAATMLFGSALAPTASIRAQEGAAVLASTTAQAVYVYPSIEIPVDDCPMDWPVDTVSGVTGNPHAADIYGGHFALVSGGNVVNLIQNIDTASLVVLNTIPMNTVGYVGGGTISVSPNETYALAAGNTEAVYIVQAPFASPILSVVPLPGKVEPNVSEAITFDPGSRAYVAHRNGISALDPPYDAVSFTIAGNRFVSVAATADGNHLLATTFSGTGQDSTLYVFSAPISATSVAEHITLPGASFLQGVAISPDGSFALVIEAFNETVYAVAAPFGSASTVEVLVLPTGVGNLEDVDISPDGMTALVTGGAGANLVAIRAPFTAAQATICLIPVTGGRGAGSVRFQASPVPSNVDDFAGSTHGDTMRLGAYPSPIRSGTSVRLVLFDYAARSTVEIVDVAGRRIRSLTGLPMEGGASAAEWDVRDEFGRAVGPGVYFVRARGTDGRHASVLIPVVR